MDQTNTKRVYKTLCKKDSKFRRIVNRFEELSDRENYSYIRRRLAEELVTAGVALPPEYMPCPYIRIAGPIAFCGSLIVFSNSISTGGGSIYSYGERVLVEASPVPFCFARHAFDRIAERLSLDAYVVHQETRKPDPAKAQADIGVWMAILRPVRRDAVCRQSVNTALLTIRHPDNHQVIGYFAIEVHGGNEPHGLVAKSFLFPGMRGTAECGHVGETEMNTAAVRVRDELRRRWNVSWCVEELTTFFMEDEMMRCFIDPMYRRPGGMDPLLELVMKC